MPDIEKVTIRIIDELIFEAQKEPTWKAENALRCLKKELLKEQEMIRQCKDCKFYAGTHPEFAMCSELDICVDSDFYCKYWRTAGS